MSAFAHLLGPGDLGKRHPVAQDPLRRGLDLLEHRGDHREEVQRDHAVLVGQHLPCRPAEDVHHLFVRDAVRLGPERRPGGRIEERDHLVVDEPLDRVRDRGSEERRLWHRLLQRVVRPLLEVEVRDDLGGHEVRERRGHLRVGAEGTDRVHPLVGVQQCPMRPGVDGRHRDREAREDDQDPDEDLAQPHPLHPFLALVLLELVLQRLVLGHDRRRIRRAIDGNVAHDSSVRGLFGSEITAILRSRSCPQPGLA